MALVQTGHGESSQSILTMRLLLVCLDYTCNKKCDDNNNKT